MKHYVVQTAEGVIRFAGNCPDDAEPPDHSDEGLITLELGAPLPPGDWHVADGLLQAGRLDLRTLDQRKADRLDILHAARAAAMVAPLVTPYGTFDADPVSRQNIADRVAAQNALARRGLPSARAFTLADNSVITLTAEDMETVGLLLGDQVDGAHVTWRELRAAVEAATTPEAVEAVAWPD